MAYSSLREIGTVCSAKQTHDKDIIPKPMTRMSKSKEMPITKLSRRGQLRLCKASDMAVGKYNCSNYIRRGTVISEINNRNINVISRQKKERRKYRWWGSDRACGRGMQMKWHEWYCWTHFCISWGNCPFTHLYKDILAHRHRACARDTQHQMSIVDVSVTLVAYGYYSIQRIYQIPGLNDMFIDLIK